VSAAPRVPLDGGERTRATADFATNLVVSAGAGTGKTTLLVTRLVAAIASGHAPLSAIAAITFTEKAAGELRARLAESLRALSLGEAEGQLDRATVTTIHGLCAEILRAYPLESGLAPGFAIDRGMSGRRLAEEEWTPFVAAELGPDGRRPELWDRVLRKFSLAQLGDIARVLAGGSISDRALSGEHRPLDLRAAIGPEALRLATEIREAVEETPGLTDAPRAWLAEAERALRVLASDGTAAARSAIAESSRIPDAMPGVRTKKVSEPEAATLTTLSERALPLLRGLAVYDETVEADLFEALLPFARRLRARQTLSGLVDFDGLLVRTRDLLRDVPEVRAALKRRYRMILVDEFQDTDPIQYEIVFLLAEREDDCAADAYETRLAPGRLFIVGDAKQSIYRFRGADYGAYRRAVRHVLDQGGEELTLSSNFRSTGAVLDSVNALFAEPRSSVWRASPYLPPYVAIHAERQGGTAPAVEIWTPNTAADALAETRRRAEGLALAAELSAWAGQGKSCRYNDVLVLFRGFSDLAPYLRALREAGVPFVVSGGRTFFERTEIIQAMAVLRAVADPEDPVALVAYRRSPAGGVPDTELFAGSGAGSPSLAAADDRLAALRAAANRLPVDAAVRHVLEASGLFALSSLSFEAAQRVANLEKLALAASELSRDGRRTLLETVEGLEEGFESDEAGDSPLADAAFDAVRVMSIHSAKGLEAPVVILADTAGGRSNRSATQFSARMTRLAHGEFVRLEGPGFRNAAAIAASIDDARHEEAEEVRLLYVALTRARDRLIVFDGGQRKSSWSEAVSSWSEGVTRRTLAAPGPWSAMDAPAASGAPEAVARFESAAAAIRTRSVLPFRSPSDLGGVAASGTESSFAALLARDVGRIVHARLSGSASADAGEAGTEAERILREFAASPLAARLAALSVLGREVPMLLGRNDERWRGAIDLLYRDTDGTVVVADFKTDSSDEGSIERHRGQLTIYAEAVRLAMPGERVRAELWMLRSGNVLEV
jgi:ATP-dependent helicase/nuclease subunit A